MLASFKYHWQFIHLSNLRDCHLLRPQSCQKSHGMVSWSCNVLAAFKTQDVQRSTLFRFIYLLILKRNKYGCIYQRDIKQNGGIQQRRMVMSYSRGIVKQKQSVTDHISYIIIDVTEGKGMQRQTCLIQTSLSSSSSINSEIYWFSSQGSSPFSETRIR